MAVKLFDSELKVMDVLWKQGDQTAKSISEILKKSIGWNQNTTYTVIKRLSERGVVRLENAVVTALVSRRQVQHSESRELVDRAFGGSLPKFLAAFTSRKKLTETEIDALQRLIDESR